MKFEIGQINPKDHEGNLVFLYGTVVADRSLPLSKKELDYLKTCRVDEPDTIVVFDRLPYKLFIVNFDSELDADQCQERLRRSAAKVVDMLRNAKQTQVSLTGEGVIPEEVVAFAEGLFLADYTFDRYKSEKPVHIEQLTIDQSFLSPDELKPLVTLWDCGIAFASVASGSTHPWPTSMPNRSPLSCSSVPLKQVLTAPFSTKSR